MRAKAYTVLDQVREKFDKYEEKIAFIEMLINSPDTNETDADILKLVYKIIVNEREQETDDETNSTTEYDSDAIELLT